MVYRDCETEWTDADPDPSCSNTDTSDPWAVLSKLEALQPLSLSFDDVDLSRFGTFLRHKYCYVFPFVFGVSHDDCCRGQLFSAPKTSQLQTLPEAETK